MQLLHYLTYASKEQDLLEHFFRQPKKTEKFSSEYLIRFCYLTNDSELNWGSHIFYQFFRLFEDLQHTLLLVLAGSKWRWQWWRRWWSWIAFCLLISFSLLIWLFAQKNSAVAATAHKHTQLSMLHCTTLLLLSLIETIMHTTFQILKHVYFILIL